MRREVAFFIGASLLLSTCKPEDKPREGPPEAEFVIPFEAQYDIQSLEFADEFQSPAVSKGQVTSITEASGIASGLANQQYIWTHEDSGNENLLYLLSKSKATVVVTYKLTGTTNVDWEDMAIGPGPVEGKSYIYLADIGDNNAVRSSVAIYRVPEPVYSPADSGMTVDLMGAEKFTIAYPDSAHDAEALMIDPVTKDLFVVSKREDRVGLYQLSYPYAAGNLDTLRFIGTFPFTGIVAADISADGNRVLIKSYSGIFYWKKQNDESIIRLLSNTPRRAPYNPVEFQGEAICWDGYSYYTLSEKLGSFIPKLYYYKAK